MNRFCIYLFLFAFCFGARPGSAEDEKTVVKAEPKPALDVAVQKTAFALTDYWLNQLGKKQVIFVMLGAKHQRVLVVAANNDHIVGRSYFGPTDFFGEGDQKGGFYFESVDKKGKGLRFSEDSNGFALFEVKPAEEKLLLDLAKYKTMRAL